MVRFERISPSADSSDEDANENEEELPEEIRNSMQALSLRRQDKGQGKGASQLTEAALAELHAENRRAFSEARAAARAELFAAAAPPLGC